MSMFVPFNGEQTEVWAMLCWTMQFERAEVAGCVWTHPHLYVHSIRFGRNGSTGQPPPGYVIRTG